MTETPEPEALRANESISLGSAGLEYQCVEIGRLVVCSGRILSCSPESVGTPEEKDSEIEADIPCGEHPITLAIRGSGDDRRAGLACLRWSDQDVVEWSSARTPAYCEHAYQDGLLDREGSGQFLALLEQDEQAICDRICAEIDESSGGSAEGCGWTTIVLEPSTGLNYVIYRSGLEKGCTASYLGKDAYGRPICLTNVYGV